MSTVLIYTSPARGHLFPVMDLALALGAAGHRAVVQTLAEEGPRLLAAGVEHRPIHPGIEALPLADYLGSNPLSAMRHSMGRWLERAPFELEDLREAIEALSPDFLLVDINSWGATAAAEAAGRPWGVFAPYCLPVPSRDAPAFGPGLPPPRSWLGRLRDRLIWAIQGLAARGPVARLGRLRAGLGLRAFGAPWELFTHPPLLLYRTAEPFEYPRSDWPDNVRALGPGLWAPPGELPPWLAELPRPRVLVSVSTEFQDDAAIVETALAALGGEPGSLIITTAAVDPGQFVSLGPHVRIERFLSHAAIVPEVDLVITHGGMGTTQRALAAGVPLCVVPWGRDQLESGRRVVECGAGTMVPRSRLQPDRLREAARQALECQAGAQRVAEAFARTGGPEEGVALIEAAIAAARPAVQGVSASA